MLRSLGLRGLLATLVIPAGLLLSEEARAQAPGAAPPPTGAPQGGAASCPPGSWFCADAQGNAQGAAATPAAPAAPATPAAPAASGGLQPLPPPSPPVVVYPKGSGGGVPVPPPYGYQERQAPPVVAYVQPAYPYPAREWGLNLHLQGAFIGARRDVGAGMGGLGVALRHKHSGYFGGELSLDLYGGRDYNGDSRGEAALGYNALFFVNPRSATQFYMLMGLGFATARVERPVAFTDRFADGTSQTSYGTDTFKYNYFGGQIGGGLEFRTSRHIAFNVDLRFFMRGRIDGNTRVPEYITSDGRGTNTSGGALLTGGMTIYF